MSNVFKKIFITSPLLVAIALSLQVGTSYAESDMNLASLRWQHRIIVVQEYDDKRADQVEAVLDKYTAEILDRDIVWYVLRSDKLKHNHHRYSLPEPSEGLREELIALLRDNKAYSTLLLGKDGGIKMRKNTLPMDEIFNLIDAMPMRIQEMRSDRRRKDE